MNRESNADSLIYEIQKEFKNNKVKFSKIDVVSLSNGPGSFTGLRIGSVIAKGICYASGSKLIALSSLDILAATVETNKTIVPLIFSNMRSNEFYYSEYKKTDGSLKRVSDYKISVMENIEKSDKFFTADAGDAKNIKDIKVAPAENKINAQVSLALEYIERSAFTDVSASEPFYLKDFQPVKS